VPGQSSVQSVLDLGPFLGVDRTKSSFYLGQGSGKIASNTDIAVSPGDFVTTYGRQLVGSVPLPSGYTFLSVTPFCSLYGTAQNDGTIGEVSYLVWSAINYSTGAGYAGYLDPVSGKNRTIGEVTPFTQAVQFGDTLYTSGGNRIIFQPNGRLRADTWQLQVDKSLAYRLTGEAVSGGGSAQVGTYQYAYTIRRSAHWRSDQGPNGKRASNSAWMLLAGGGQVTMSLETPQSQIFTTQPVVFTYPKNPGETLSELEIRVIGELTQTVNSDPQIGQLCTAYPSITQNGQINDSYMSVYINQPGSNGNNYKMWLTITGNGNQAYPAQGGGNSPFQFGNNSGSEATLSPNMATYQESSPVYTPQFEVATSFTPALVAGLIGAKAMASGTDDSGETYYGVLYRSSLLNPTYVMVDYLINLNTTTDGNGNVVFKDPYTDAEIQNNVILAEHNDPPPAVGQVYPGPLLNQLPNGLNTSPPETIDESDQRVSFHYNNPILIEKHQSRMFAFTMYPTMPTSYQTDSTWRNRVQFQPQLWYSNYSVPWSFDDVDQLLLVGQEDAAGNYAIDSGTNAPWSPGSQLTDFPVGMASTGSLLVLFKRRSTSVLFGDSPAEFQQSLREGFDIGCAAANSVVAAEGGVFWLADLPVGVYFFNGNAPEYISEDIRADLITFNNINELQLASGGYSWDQHQSAQPGLRPRHHLLLWYGSAEVVHAPVWQRRAVRHATQSSDGGHHHADAQHD
jgi:hypothetical protein